MTPPMAAPSASPPPFPGDAAWYGSINYLLNLSFAGAASCLLLFLLVKLRSDHRSFRGLPAKIRAVFLADIARHCGADAAQFLRTERSCFLLLLALSLISLFFTLPLNLFSPIQINDQFTRTTVSHIPTGSPVLWVHFLLTVVVTGLAHYAISKMEDQLGSSRFNDITSIAMFTVMVQGIPKGLAADRVPLEEYFRDRYTDKVFRVVVPFDLCGLDELVDSWVKVGADIEHMEARLDAGEGSDAAGNGMWRRVVDVWEGVKVKLGFTDEERLSKLRNLRLVLESKFMDYKEGRAPGAGIAFVVFRDVYTANQAVQEFRAERRRRPIGRFFPLMELQLERSRWRVELAPPASDIYWNHLGLSKLSLRLRRVAVNTCLLLMLLFCSSPLAVINAMKSAARIINAEAVDNAQLWLAWIEGSSWFGTIFLQFMPNVLIFVSMYIIVPSALSYLSKFEKHLTVSGEQCAALLKMVCFFLVNLILLRALLESSLESAILHMGSCYLDGEDCKRIEQYMSPSFLSRSCLSALAFLITSTFLGISFDLLAPVPWIKKTIRKFRKNDMLQLVPEQNEDLHVEQNPEENNIHEPLMAESQDSLVLNGVEGLDLPVYPVNRSFHVPKQTFDFAQYYAFNLTILALTMIYCLLSPLVVPVGAVYFGYRYVVDKYNFLFVYRHRGFPAGNDGKLINRVLCIMRFCVILFLLSMLLFFSVKGDSTKLQAIFTFGLLIFYKLLPSRTNRFQPSILEGLQNVDSFVDGPTDYEVFSQPDFDWDVYRH